MTGHTGRQLALNVHLRDDATLENYLPLGTSELLLQSLQGQLSPEGEPIIYVHGPADSGRTHLLQAACHLAGAEAQYLPLAELQSYPPADILQSIETLKLVCLDDLQAVLGQAEWESELFHLFNRARENQCRLLVSADAAPRALKVDLADLRSRLGWGIVYRLPTVTDEQREQLIVFRASRRGLSLAPEVASYIVSRATRSMDSLLGLLDTLDKASLAQQRSLSIPFVKATLGW
ncbi:MAG: DnaA regulatory inactivator Hda [Halieaceae bacterium]